MLGRGNFASVYVAKHEETGREVAVKVLSKSKFDTRPKMLPSIIQEIGILMSLDAHVCGNSAVYFRGFANRVMHFI